MGFGTLLAIWALGVVVAWFQLVYWNENKTIDPALEPYEIILMCILSWLIYPCHAVARFFNNFKK